jgi:DNA polymerase-3 subunit epsilon
MERHGLVCFARHRALGDARVLHDFWAKLHAELPEAALAGAAHHQLEAHRLPEHLPEGLPDELPEGPGVYRFYGLDDVLLFVGRSKSLRTHVLGHFAGLHAKDHAGKGGEDGKLGRQVRRIDWLETAGELGAWLREAEWIKTQRPRYNRRLKPTSESVTINLSERTGAAEFAALAELAPEQLARSFGVFHSLKEARKALTEIARAQLLCSKSLGLEESAGSCFAYQVGRCKGACIGKEPPILHRVRVQMALSPLKLKPWPFPGRVALRERSSLGGDELHVLDQWCYLGTARSEEELAALAEKPARAAFDPHVYRILTRYLSNHPQLEWHALAPDERVSDAMTE